MQRPIKNKPFTTQIEISPGFDLFIGRKKSVIDKPARFEMKREYWMDSLDGISVDFISPRPVSEVFSLFIDGKLFATTRPTGSKRFSVKIRKPTSKRSRLQIHLVKKYTKMAAP